MELSNPISRYQQEADSLPKGSPPEESGFLENFNARLGLLITEELPLISRMIPSETESMRKEQLYKYAETDDALKSILANTWSPDRGLNIERAAIYANKVLGYKDVPIQEDYDKRRAEEYDNYRSYSHNIMQHSNWMGKAGQFAAMPFMLLDPIYSAGMLTGYGGAATALQAAGRVAAIEMGLETVATPFIKTWKEDIGTDYSPVEIITNIVGAGVGAGLGAGVGKFLELRGLSKVEGMFDTLDLEAPHGSVKMHADFLRGTIKKNPEMESLLKPVLHVLDNYPDQAADAAKVMQLDLRLSEDLNKIHPWKGVAKKTDPEKTVEQFAVEQEHAYDDFQTWFDTQEMDKTAIRGSSSYEGVSTITKEDVLDRYIRKEQETFENYMATNIDSPDPADATEASVIDWFSERATKVEQQELQEAVENFDATEAGLSEFARKLYKKDMDAEALQELKAATVGVDNTDDPYIWQLRRDFVEKTKKNVEKFHIPETATPEVTLEDFATVITKIKEEVQKEIKAVELAPEIRQLDKEVSDNVIQSFSEVKSYDTIIQELKNIKVRDC